MNTVSETVSDTKKKYLEIDFSPAIHKALPAVIAFAKKCGITSFVIYFRKQGAGSAEMLLEFCAVAEKEKISCCVAVSFAEREVITGLLQKKNLRSRLRICTEKALLSFLAEKALFPGVTVELYYDKEQQQYWNITEAMALCRANAVSYIFGCSDSYITAAEDELEKICGGNANTPFPGSKNCFRFTDGVFLSEDGTLFPCRGLRDLSVCNIFSENFDELFTNSTVLSFYQNYMNKLKKPCKTCSSFGACAGCRGRAYQFSKDFLSADPGCPANKSKLHTIVKLPVKDPENYLPHKKPMLMISELHRICDNFCESVCIIQPDNPFLQQDGSLHPAAFIEIGAQSMAFLDAFLHPDSRLEGMLVEVKNFEYSGIQVYEQAELQVSGKKIYEMAPWNIGSFKICTENGEMIAAGELKVCQFQNPE